MEAVGWSYDEDEEDEEGEEEDEEDEALNAINEQGGHGILVYSDLQLAFSSASYNKLLSVVCHVQVAGGKVVVLLVLRDTSMVFSLVLGWVFGVYYEIHLCTEVWFAGRVASDDIRILHPATNQLSWLNDCQALYSLQFLCLAAVLWAKP